MELERLERIAKLLAEGKTIEQIAGEVGLSYWMVHYAIRKNNMQLPPATQWRLPAQTARLIRRMILHTNLGPSEIATKLQLRSRMPIYRIIWKMREKAERQGADEQFEPVATSPKRCPVHGMVTVWPCVACAAINKK
jgi:hypothetical protein